ncbi:MAG: sugar phosphate isomerase/epimerase [Candidatus Latescibacteria bacterium]|nr:sugar phosphate isomerase/epimerase [Candidatus Latescibacterota bacterium]
MINRRSFLISSVMGALAGSSMRGGLVNPGSCNAQTLCGTIRKSLYYGMIKGDMSIAEKFNIAKRAGFEGVEVPTVEEPEKVSEMKEAVQNVGVRIHSIMNQAHWKYPFSSDDPEVIETGMKGMETSLRNAKEYGADAVLLVPAVVNAETSYKDAYTRSQSNIKKLLPLAKELNIVIAIENVWNKFLLSPLEFARYIDEIDSPYLQAYFDCGNIALYGYPHDWIRTLGKRIVKVHIKGFNVNDKQFTNLGDGTIDWPEIRRAFSDINYNGYMSAELKGGHETYLRDVSRRMDSIIAGEVIQ